MTLFEKCAAVLASLNQVEIARRNASQRAAIERRVREWSDCATRLEKAREKTTWVDLSPQAFAECRTEWTKTRELAESAADRLQDTGDASSLSEDPLWTQLLASARGTTEAIENATAVAWQAFIQEQAPVESAAAVRGRLSLTPGNEQALREYEPVYMTYSKLKNQPGPRTPTDRQALLESLSQCRELFGRFRFDVPSDVDTFFKAVNSGGASLDLLTPLVMQWLRENGQTNRYVVRSVQR